MLALILVSLFSPDAEACSLAYAQPEWAYPQHGDVDVARDQPLRVQFTGGETEEQVVRVTEAHSGSEIEGDLSYLCPGTMFSNRGCILTFEPAEGSWPEDSELQWSIGPEWLFETEEDASGFGWMSGSFSTSDRWLDGSAVEDLGLDGAHTHWEGESFCHSGNILYGEFELSGQLVEAGGWVELVVSVESDGDDTLPEERIVELQLIEEADSFSRILASQISGTREEVCYSARVFSANGLDDASVEGPCLKWVGTKAGSGVSRCSTLGVHDPLSTTWLGLLGLVAFWRRQRR